MEDVWIDAVSQFLRGNSWRKKVVNYVDKNCILFAEDDNEITAFTHGQYEIWRDFKNMVEDSISSVLNDLGGSSESFSKACDERLAEQDKGPRDAAVKDVLRKLLTYDNFEDFGFMMKLRWREIENNDFCDADYLANETTSNDNNNRDEEEVYEGKKNQQVHAQSLAYGSNNHSEYNNTNNNNGSSSSSKTSAEDNRNNNNYNETEDEKVEKLRRELQRKEWEIQLEIAKSITENDDTSNKKEPELVEWARGVVHMNKLLLPGSGASGKDISEHRRTLSILRNKVDLMVARKMLEDNDNIRAKLIEDREKNNFNSMNGTNGGSTNNNTSSMNDLIELDEKNLNELIEMHAEKQNDVNMQRENCTVYFHDQRISQEAYSEVYFFLKDMIKQNNSFIFEQDEVHDFIFKRIGHEEMSLVPELLKLLVLEDEEAWLQEHIRQIVSGEKQNNNDNNSNNNSNDNVAFDIHNQAMIKEQEELLKQINIEKQIAIENAEKIVNKERDGRMMMESKFKEVEMEKAMLKEQMDNMVDKAEVEATAKKMEEDMEKRIEAEVKARMEAYERLQESQRQELETKRKMMEEEAIEFQQKMEKLEQQKKVALKKEEQIRALQKKATQVARAALAKKRELESFNEATKEAETKRLEEEAFQASERKKKLDDEKEKLVIMQQKREAEEVKLKKEQEKRQLLQINIEKEIEIKKKEHFDNHEHKTKRLQEEFEHKARAHVEAQRREVAAMKNKLKERLKAKKMRMKKKRREKMQQQQQEVANGRQEDFMMDESEMRATLSKAKIKEISAALNGSGGDEGILMTKNVDNTINGTAGQKNSPMNSEKIQVSFIQHIYLCIYLYLSIYIYTPFKFNRNI